MIRTVLSTSVLSMLALFLAACQPKAQETNLTDAQKDTQLTMFMQDSTMVNTMMENIAANGGMRMMMMEKMIRQVRADSGAKMQMCRMMIDDSEMHATMMQMMGGGMMTNGVMMKKETKP